MPIYEVSTWISTGELEHEWTRMHTEWVKSDHVGDALESMFAQPTWDIEERGPYTQATRLDGQFRLLAKIIPTLKARRVRIKT